jgi:hypothetical protein
MQYVIAIGLSLVLASSSGAVRARCSVPSVASALEEAKSVFVGKVISVQDPGLPADDRLSFKIISLVRSIKVRFAVDHIYAGREAKEIEVATRTGGLEFGYDFKVGEKYLVYAQGEDEEKSVLIVKGCGRTRLVEEATEDMRILKDLVQAKVQNPN